MNKSLIEAHFQTLLNKFSELNILISQTRSAFNSEFNRLLTSESNLEKLPPERIQSIATHNSNYRKLSNGEVVSYHRSLLSLNDLKHRLLMRCNKHFSWILAEAFESFEDYIEAATAFAGMRNKPSWITTWPKENPNDLDGKDFEWFLAKSQRINGLTGKLKVIKAAYPEIAILEFKNHFELDLNFVLSAVEKMRHSIVHNAGQFKDHREFIKKIFEATGKSNNGKYEPANLSLIESLIGEHDKKYFILLIDEYDENSIDILNHRYTPRLDPILSWLLSYADSVHAESLRYEE